MPEFPVAAFPLTHGAWLQTGMQGVTPGGEGRGNGVQPDSVPGTEAEPLLLVPTHGLV